jgi:hypothetical protein
MSHSASLPTGPDGPMADQRLTERMVARIKAAHRHIREQPALGSRKGRTRRGADGDARALRRVFLDLGDSYRTYRRRTGEPIAPEVRDAALRFRRELNLQSLVFVAASLDRLDGDLVR